MIILRVQSTIEPPGTNSQVRGNSRLPSSFRQKVFLSSIDVSYRPLRGFPRMVSEMCVGINGDCKVCGNLDDLVYRVHRLFERVVEPGDRFERKQDPG